MPRIRADKSKYKHDDFVKFIRHGMIDAGIRTVTQLSDLTGIPRVTLSRRLSDPESFTLKELELLNSIIPIDMDIVLK